jgi:hypothetical protein
VTTCSDCRFYDERYTKADHGDCRISLPPWMATNTPRNREYTPVWGNDYCDLGQPKETS